MMYKEKYLERPQLIEATCILLLALLCFITYFQVLNFDFVLLDDNVYLNDDEIISGFSWAGMMHAFTDVVHVNWHPVTVITFQIDRSVYGSWPGGYHLTNVLLHILNSLLLFKVFRLFGASIFVSFFCASIFAIHPLNVESIAWISERKGLLSTLFLLAALYAYVKYVKGDISSRKWYWLSVMAFAFSVMSKANTVTFPLLLLLLDYWPLQRFKLNVSMVDTLKRLIVEKWPFFLLSIIVTIITVVVHNSSGALKLTHTTGIDVRFTNYFISIQKYLSLIFYPQDLIVFHPYNELRLNNLDLIIGLSLFVAISYFSLRQIKNQPFIFVGWSAFLVLWLPVAGIIQTGGHAYADRYMYLPMVGVLFLAANILDKLRRPLVPVAILVLVIGFASTITFKQLAVWKNTETLFKHALSVEPDNYVLRYNLIYYYSLNQEWQNVIRQYHIARTIFPKSVELYDLVSQSLYDGGQIEEAENVIIDALEALPNNAAMHRNLGKIRYKQKKYMDAILSLKNSIELDKSDIDSRLVLGMSQLRLQRYKDAYITFLEAEKLSPSSVQIQIGLAEAALAAGNKLMASKHLFYALELSPDNEYLKNKLIELNKE